MSDENPTPRPGRTFVVPATGPIARRLVALLRARWRCEPNGDGGHAKPPLWGVCPICREEALGVGAWVDGSLRVSCWSCGALEEDVAAVLGVVLGVVQAEQAPKLADPGPIVRRLGVNLRRGVRR